jgi:hypothetical protein
MNTHTLPAAAGTPHINLLGFECGLHMGPPIVHAASGTELFGEAFYDALKRIDEFTEPGRTLLLDLQAALERVAQAAPRSPLVFRDTAPGAYLPTCLSGPSAPAALQHTGVRAAEVAQLLDDLARVGAKADGELIGICSWASAVINALLTGLNVEQLA